MRIEPVAAEPQPLDLDADPLPLGEVDGEQVHVLALHHAVHRRVERHGLRLLHEPVGLHLVDDRQRTDPERPILADARLRPHVHDVLAERAVLGDVDHRLERLCVDRLERPDDEPVVAVEQDLLGVAEAVTRERQLAIAAALHATREDDRQLRRRRGRHDGRHDQSHDERHEQGDAAEEPPRRRKGSLGRRGACRLHRILQHWDSLPGRGRAAVTRSAACGPCRRRRSRSAGRRAP